MIIQRKIDIDSPLTAAQEKMLRELASRPAVTDDDFPELTQEQLSQFRRISTERRDGRRKQSVTLRLSPQALEKAKSLGKGYTSVLSRILENALSNPGVIRQNI